MRRPISYPTIFYGLLLAFACWRGFSGGVTGDELASLCVLGFVYALGGTHGLYLGWSHQRRMDGWAGRYVDRVEAARIKATQVIQDRDRERV